MIPGHGTRPLPCCAAICRAVPVALVLGLAACAGPDRSGTGQPVTLDGTVYRVVSDRADGGSRLRIEGAETADTALRVFSAHCGLAADMALGPGSVRRDAGSGDWVVDTACGT